MYVYVAYGWPSVAFIVKWTTPKVWLPKGLTIRRTGRQIGRQMPNKVIPIGGSAKQRQHNNYPEYHFLLFKDLYSSFPEIRHLTRLYRQPIPYTSERIQIRHIEDIVLDHVVTRTGYCPQFPSVHSLANSNHEDVHSCTFCQVCLVCRSESVLWSPIGQ